MDNLDKLKEEAREEIITQIQKMADNVPPNLLLNEIVGKLEVEKIIDKAIQATKERDIEVVEKHGNLPFKHPMDCECQVCNRIAGINYVIRELAQALHNLE